MYHSITFSLSVPYLENGEVVLQDARNTWESWYLIPSSRPVIAPPEPNTNLVEIPGRDGPIDFSTYLTGGVTYKSRTGSLEFYVENDHEDWTMIHDKIANYLHGQEVYMILEDIPGYYYHGRIAMNEWASESWNSRVVLNYTLDPFIKEISEGGGT